MGFFSWRNQDTGKAIYNHFVAKNSDESTSTMSDDKGNKWTDTAYGGYGVFGLKDYYELLAEMNIELVKKIDPSINMERDIEGEYDDAEAVRSIGIRIANDTSLKGVKFPNLNFDRNAEYQEGTQPENANGQGHWEEDYTI
jgi:hypothetical protein